MCYIYKPTLPIACCYTKPLFTKCSHHHHDLCYKINHDGSAGSVKERTSTTPDKTITDNGVHGAPGVHSFEWKYSATCCAILSVKSNGNTNVCSEQSL